MEQRDGRDARPQQRRGGTDGHVPLAQARPFVLETSLSDWYPVYQINAYIKQADKMAQIYSDLHQNIQDKFNEAGIEIMSLHYMAVRDGNETTTPKEYQKSNNPSNKAGEESKSE